MNRKSLFSVEDEVALHPERNRERPQAEDLPEARDEITDPESCFYSSTAFEPGVGSGGRASRRNQRASAISDSWIRISPLL